MLQENVPLAEMGGYAAQSELIRLHPSMPLQARTLDFDIEVAHLDHKHPPFLLQFPIQATGWKVVDMVMSGGSLYAAVSVLKRGTQIVAFNLHTRKVDSQVALQSQGQSLSVILLAGDCRLWALVNIQGQGYTKYTIQHREEGLLMIDERRLSNNALSKVFKRVPAVVRASEQSREQKLFSFLTFDEKTVKIWT
jgi:hypothetical protein